MNEIQEWTDILLALRELNEDQRNEFMIRLRTATIEDPDNPLVGMIEDLLKQETTH